MIDEFVHKYIDKTKLLILIVRKFTIQMHCKLYGLQNNTRAYEMSKIIIEGFVYNQTSLHSTSDLLALSLFCDPNSKIYVLIVNKVTIIILKPVFTSILLLFT